ncbi:sensor histidine kinase [Terrimonas sp. NA20]|uniref:Sensor histidine kinase n=1 Tax=Terrimonas ginsenosidimutans TaxID=2908004 RepID=A0ABS9KYP8_9BACT|nr:sensor histidine kinase [Terrimonas ginsenosidimutans]MCG2617512.1 sensor histidine kinase [Terrimonas ginsenosidimutans]
MSKAVSTKPLEKNSFEHMNWIKRTGFGSRYISFYELLIWLIYVCVFKYSDYASSSHLPRMRANFPFPELIIFAIATTLYVIPFYRWLGPFFLKKKWRIGLFFFTLFYFLFVAKWTNLLVSYLFLQNNHSEVMQLFYEKQYQWYLHSVGLRGYKLTETMFDLLAFVSVMFTRYAFETEQKKHALEKDNLVLQLETLKAQLHPHFLFNTLNSIYGMSLTGEPDTPEYILRLSDMMRYILYDCQQSKVQLEKDLEFLDNYLQMEKKRYPQADIEFSVENNAPGQYKIAPLLLIPFLENSFKHGSHRVMDSGYIRGKLIVHDKELEFDLSNSIILTTPQQKAAYGGVGIANVKKRLALYYPGTHTLKIEEDQSTYSVKLKISLTK